MAPTTYLVGVEGDWGWAGKIDNDDPNEATETKSNDISTLRGLREFAAPLF